MRSPSIRWLALATLAAGSLTACPSDDPGVGPTGPAEVSVTVSTAPSLTPSETGSPAAEGEDELDLSGTWSGTWTNFTPNNDSGTLQIEWEQVSSHLEGTITIGGTPCLTGGAITGEVDGRDITFGVVQGEVEVSYSARSDGAFGLLGTYSTSCGNAQGKLGSRVRRLSSVGAQSAGSTSTTDLTR